MGNSAGRKLQWGEGRRDGTDVEFLVEFLHGELGDDVFARLDAGELGRGEVLTGFDVAGVGGVVFEGSNFGFGEGKGGVSGMGGDVGGGLGWIAGGGGGHGGLRVLFCFVGCREYRRNSEWCCGYVFKRICKLVLTTFNNRTRYICNSRSGQLLQFFSACELRANISH